MKSRNRLFSYSTKKPGSSVILIHFYMRDSIDWRTIAIGGIVVKRRAYDPRAVGSIPALTTFEVSILGQGVSTNCASLHPGV